MIGGGDCQAQQIGQCLNKPVWEQMNFWAVLMKAKYTLFLVFPMFPHAFVFWIFVGLRLFSLSGLNLISIKLCF